MTLASRGLMFYDFGAGCDISSQEIILLHHELGDKNELICPLIF